MKISLTDREADVMQVLWGHGPSVVSDLQSRLSYKLAYTTVLTVLRTLEAKRYVKHEEEGRQHLLQPFSSRPLRKVRSIC